MGLIAECGGKGVKWKCTWSMRLGFFFYGLGIYGVIVLGRKRVLDISKSWISVCETGACGYIVCFNVYLDAGLHLKYLRRWVYYVKGLRN